MQAGAQKLGVIEASYASAIIGHFSLKTTGLNGKGDTNPKRERGMPQTILGHHGSASLTLRVGMWVEQVSRDPNRYEVSEPELLRG